MNWLGVTQMNAHGIEGMPWSIAFPRLDVHLSQVHLLIL